MDDPEIWRWVWVVLAVLFIIGEMMSAGTFFLAPFAVGAIMAAVLAFLGVNAIVTFGVFIVVSAASFAAMRPLARRLDRDQPTDGIGAKRLMGSTGVVLQNIPGGTELGLVRVGREKWRAESADQSVLSEGVPIKVVEVRGTRVVVSATNRPGFPTLPSNEAGASG